MKSHTQRQKKTRVEEEERIEVDPQECEILYVIKDILKKEHYTASDIIKYTLMITNIKNPEIKAKIVTHSDYNKDFFEDLKKNYYVSDIFSGIGSSQWLERNFRKIKYFIQGELEEDENNKNTENFDNLIKFLNSNSDNKEITFK